MGRHLIDLTGLRFGRLTVTKFVEFDKDNESMWLCRCDCGNEKVIRQGNLRRKNKPTKSCGCLSKEVSRKTNSKHCESKTKLYKIWVSMKNRCNCGKAGGYSVYGGKGIRVCSEWSEYLGFKKWALSNGYKPDLSIERKDNNKGYEPENCEWIPLKDQYQNRTTNRYITINGQTKYLAEWCRYYGIGYGTARRRIVQNKPQDEWFTPPKKQSRIIARV
jgi:hypothetical protein